MIKWHYLTRQMSRNIFFLSVIWFESGDIIYATNPHLQNLWKKYCMIAEELIVVTPFGRLSPSSTTTKRRRRRLMPNGVISSDGNTRDHFTYFLIFSHVFIFFHIFLIFSHISHILAQAGPKFTAAPKSQDTMRQNSNTQKSTTWFPFPRGLLLRSSA